MAEPISSLTSATDDDDNFVNRPRNGLGVPLQGDVVVYCGETN